MLQFDPVAHQYSVGTQPYWSVTQVLSGLKLTPPYPEEDRGQKAFGTACHKAVELAMLDRLDFEKTHPDLIPYVNGAMEKKREMRIRPIATELQLWEPSLCVAGTLDLFCWIYDDEQLAIIDYKSGSAPIATELQTGGYEYLLREMDRTGKIPPVMGSIARCALYAGYPIRRFSMKLTPERAIVKEYRDPYDIHAWQAAVTLFKWMKDRRKEV